MKSNYPSERLCEQLMEDFHEALFIMPSSILDGTEKFVNVNQIACKMLGYSRKQLLKLSLQNLFPPERIDDLLPILKMLKTEGRAIYKTVLLRKDGSKLPVEINSKIFQLERKSICLVMVRDITIVLSLKKKLGEKEDQLRSLSKLLLTVREEERSRISKELHDELGQNLAFLKMEVNSIKKGLPKLFPDLRIEFEKLLGHLQEIAENVRHISQDLQPRGLKELGFSSAARLLIQESCQHYGIKVGVDLDAVVDSLLPEAQFNLYRIIQESLTNIGKHAQAAEISVRIKEHDDQIFICIKDDGKGFDLRRAAVNKGLGLLTIKERACLMGGQLEIKSQRGKGTEIRLIIPLNKAD